MTADWHPGLDDPERAPSETAPDSATKARSGAASPYGRGEHVPLKRWALLIILLLLLALLGYATYYFTVNKRLPIPRPAGPEEVVKPPVYLYSIVGQGDSALERPVGVAVSPDNKVYVVDFGNKQVRVFERRGAYLFSFDKVDDGRLTALSRPVHLAISPAGELWVTDRRARALYVFKLDGTFARRVDPDGDPAFDWTPLALGFGPGGEAYVTDVADTKKHRLLFMDDAGAVRKIIGKTVSVGRPTESPGGFFFPNGVAVASDGRIFVADGDNRRVQVFDKNGEFEFVIDTKGVPRGVVIDDEDRLYVVNTISHDVDIYDLDGKLITRFGGQGIGPGQFNYPNDIALDADGQIYVTDRENHQVQVWAWPRAEVPEVFVPKTAGQWVLCLGPLLLIPPIYLLLRRRRYVVTADFVDAMAEAGEIRTMVRRRWLWVTPEADHAAYIGRVEDDVDLGELIRPEQHSESDADDLVRRLTILETDAILLSIAARHKRLCTQDPDVARLATLLGVDVYDRQRFLERYGTNRVSR